MDYAYITLKHSTQIHDTILNDKYMKPIEITIPHLEIKDILHESCLLIPVLNDIVNEYLLDIMTCTYNIIVKNRKFELDIAWYGIINFESLSFQYTTVSEIYLNCYRFRTNMSGRFSFIKDNEYHFVNDHLNFLDYYFHNMYDVHFYVNSTQIDKQIRPKYSRTEYGYEFTINYPNDKVCINRQILNTEHLEITGHIIHQFNNVIKEIANIKCHMFF